MRTKYPNYYKHWKKFPDFKHRRKQVTSWNVELIGGTKRGAVILVDSKKEKFKDEINFMNYNVAVNEYNDLTSGLRVMNLLERNN